MNNRTDSHYDAAYFRWQAAHGEFGGWANLGKFASFISPESRVLDFGCGGGFLLKNLMCREKIGVEINPHARAVALENIDRVYASAADVPAASVDVIISNNALEHTPEPLSVLKALYRNLVPGGLIVFVVPCESISNKYRPDDINQHLFSWSPMCAGNLFAAAGFNVIEARAYIHKWPPLAALISRFGKRFLFDLACRIYGHMERSWFQVRVVAQKPDDKT